MSDFNPWSLTRPQPRSVTREFTDPTQPGASVTLTFVVPSVPEMLRAGSVGAEWDKEFVQSGNAFPAPDGGEPVYLTTDFCNTVAMLHVLDTEKHDLMWWVGLSLMMPKAFMKIAEWSGKLIEQGQESSGN